MDTLTHGLLGAAAGALPWPKRPGSAGLPPRAARAGLLVAVLAAELPDLDYLLPGGNAVLHTLKAHRGLTHALVAVPAVAAVATAVGKAVFREVPVVPLYLRALLTVPLAHLLPDLWTGWGTRLFLPFSDTRAALDWTMVVDPYFTLPLLAGAVWALVRRPRWRMALLAGLAVSSLYLGARVLLAHHLGEVVAGAYPGKRTHVFPAPLSIARWRYVVELEGQWAAGSVSVGHAPQEQSRLHTAPDGPLPPWLAEVPTVKEALAWARFPLVRVRAVGPGTRQVEIADLRYHLHGQPTLTFVLTVDESGHVQEARLDRGGSPRELLRRWRSGGG